MLFLYYLIINIYRDIMDTQNQSYFKLPCLFTFIYFGCLILKSIINLVIKSDSYLSEGDIYIAQLIYSLTLGSMNYYFLVFIISVFFCQKYCLYNVSKNWKIISLLSVIFFLITYFLQTPLFEFGFEIFMQFHNYFLINFDFINDDSFPYFYFIFTYRLILIVDLFVLIIMFYFIGRNNIIYRSAINFNSDQLEKIHIQLYSIFLSYISLAIIYHFLQPSISLVMAPILIGLLLSVILYILFTVVIKNSFAQVNSKVSFAKLILTGVVTTFLSGLVSTTIYYVIFMNDISPSLSLISEIQSQPLNNLIFLLAINLLLSLLISRYFIKFLYKKDESLFIN